MESWVIWFEQGTTREIFLKELIITNVCVWANWFDLQENQKYQQKADIKTHQSD